MATFVFEEDKCDPKDTIITNLCLVIAIVKMEELTQQCHEQSPRVYCRPPSISCSWSQGCQEQPWKHTIQSNEKHKCKLINFIAHLLPAR